MLLRKKDAAINVGPGDHIQEMMEVQDWTQQDLADVLGVSLKHVNKLLNNEQAISLEMARSLSEAFGPGPEFWMNVDAGYRLNKEVDKTDIAISIRSKIYRNMPLGELFRKGWLPKTKDHVKLKKLVCEFWGIKNLEFGFMQKALSAPEYRKSESCSQFSNRAALTWFQMAKNLAGNYHALEFNQRKLAELSDNLADYTTKKDGINIVINELKETGVIFFVLGHLQKTYLDGAAFMSQGNPVIVYTGRYNRNDHFWFTIAHEIAHVLFHIKKEDEFFIDEKLSEKKTDQKEDEANAYAAQWLRQPAILNFFKSKMKYVRQQDIEECAEELSIHPGIVVGTLAFHGKVSYRHLHRFADKALDEISNDFKFQPDCN